MKARRKYKSFPKVGTSGREGGHKERGMGCIWWMCFLFIYKNRMKPVEIVLRKGEEGE
jgi:hypothetical protein